ncbi:MAG: MATE family efflux transporter [Clostridia bacterium]|nr:MATE family efflux transporter [Clostridia bacterium]
MIRKLIKQMLTAQILSALTVSLCLLIDSIMIGQFLGVDAIAAYGLANPLLLVIGAVGSMLSAGAQVCCSKSIGKGSQEETNKGFSSVTCIALVISGMFLLVFLLLREPLAALLGAGTDGPLKKSTADYIAGFSIGAPGSMGALILVPFLQMAGQSKLLIAAVATMTVADIALDLLNALVFHGGMFGMGLASSLSYYAALLVGGIYFFSKKCVFRFSLKDIGSEKIRELLADGVPTVFGMASTVVLTFVLNKILLQPSNGGSMAVAAYSVIMTIINSANCINTGIGGVSLTLSAVLYNEEDRTGLREMLHAMIRYSLILGAFMAVALQFAAPFCVRLFLPEAGSSQTMAILGTRLFALGILPCCLISMLKNICYGTGRVGRTELISVMEGAVLPSLAAWLLGLLFHTTGIWLCYLAGEILMLAGIWIYVCRKNHRKVPYANDLLMLPEGFGVPEEDLLEREIHTLQDVTTVSEEAGLFCTEHGSGSAVSNRIALCIEEMGINTVTYGFGKEHDRHLSVRVQHKGKRWTLRFRDDCREFNPVTYAANRPEGDGLGIKLVMAIADEVRYTYTMNLNNLTIFMNDKKQD